MTNSGFSFLTLVQRRHVPLKDQLAIHVSHASLVCIFNLTDLRFNFMIFIRVRIARHCANFTHRNQQ